MDNLWIVEQKVKTNGFITHRHVVYEPGKRSYFNLEVRVEIEAVSYN